MIVMSVREMCVEWSGGFPPVNDPAMQGQKDPKGGFNIEVKNFVLFLLCADKKIDIKVQPLYHNKHLLALIISGSAQKRQSKQHSVVHGGD